MLTTEQLGLLLRETADRPTLSVYVDTRAFDPAMRHSWRMALGSALRAERSRIPREHERRAFDAAAAHLEDELPPHAHHGTASGWVAFITEDGPLYVAAIPVELPTLAAWRDGPVIGPYLAALTKHRAVLVGVADGREARFYRYSRETLTHFPLLNIVMDPGTTDASEHASPSRATSHSVPRGAVDTDRSKRRRRDAIRRSATGIAERLARLAQPSDWILIDAPAGFLRRMRSALPPELVGRTWLSSNIGQGTSHAEIAREARQAARLLRASQDRAIVDRLIDRVGAPTGRSAVGSTWVQRALQDRAVETLVIADSTLAMRTTETEDVIRSALSQGATVALVSGAAGRDLERASDGVGAHLRFSIAGRANASVMAGAGPVLPDRLEWTETTSGA